MNTPLPQSNAALFASDHTRRHPSEHSHGVSWPAIFAGATGANQPMLKDPNKIYPGQQLRIPPKS